MAQNPNAGDLIHSVAFGKRVEQGDEFGNTQGPFAEQFSCRAAYLHLKGGESVLAARLEGKHSQVIRVRFNSNTRQITADWYVKDKRTDMLFAVSDVTPSENRQFVDVLIDWAGIETLKDNEGRYIIGNPQGALSPTLWRLPVVETQAIAVGKFLTGAFQMGAQVFDRWDARIETGFVNDDFIKNLITILGEERLALAVYRPEAFVTGNINPAP